MAVPAETVIAQLLLKGPWLRLRALLLAPESSKEGPVVVAQDPQVVWTFPRPVDHGNRFVLGFVQIRLHDFVTRNCLLGYGGSLL